MKPLIYSCSGCSSAAQAADLIARRMDRAGLAEMSCIAGVGGQVAPLLKKAREAECIVAIDGCPLACARACLNNAGLNPALHIDLSQLGIAKKYHLDPRPEELLKAAGHVRSALNTLRDSGGSHA